MARLKYWIPAICMAFMISGFSTHYFSGEQTSRIIVPFFHWLLPAESPQTLRLIHIAIRKGAHAGEFGVFSIALFYGVRADRSGWALRWSIIALLIALCYAGLDEWHQSFVPHRHARVADVCIDFVGALFAQAAVFIYAKLRGDRSSLQSLPGAR